MANFQAEPVQLNAWIIGDQNKITNLNLSPQAQIFKVSNMYSWTYVITVPEISNSRCMHERSDSGLWSSFWTATLTLQAKEIRPILVNNNYSKHNQQHSHLQAPARMVYIKWSRPICHVWIIILTRCNCRIMNRYPIFRNNSCIWSSYSICIILISEQLI